MNFARALRFLLPLVAFATLSNAQAIVQHRWIETDADQDGKPDVVAVMNLADVAFNQKGELVGVFFKIVKGTDISQAKTPGLNLFGIQLLGGGAPVPPYKTDHNLIGAPTASVKVAGAEAIEKPVTTVNGDFLEANFKYKQGAANVEKKYLINSRRLTMDLEVKVNGVASYPLEFVGWNARPNIRLLGEGAAQPIETGSVDKTIYAGMWGAWNEALLVRPADGVTPFPAKTEIRKDQIKRDGQSAEVERGVMTLTLPGNQATKLRFYGGPHELIRLDLEGHASLPGYFQPNIFGQLSLALLGILKSLHNVIGSWGLTIILFTILLRLLLWPLLHSQLRSSAEMQALQPKMNEIREKYKSDPQKQQAEMAKLYQENKVNPLGGCGPLFLQMPILIVLWRVFANYEFDQGFLWLRDLALPDNLLILPLLYVAVNIAQTYYYTQNNPEMFRTQILVQLIFVYLTLQFPSGVTLYYVLSTIIQVGQQWYINKQLGVKPAQMPSFSSMMKSARESAQEAPKDVKTVDAKASKAKK